MLTALTWTHPVHGLVTELPGGTEVSEQSVVDLAGRRRRSQSDRQRRRRVYERRVADPVTGRLVAQVPPDVHGKSWTYRKLGCRCAPCTNANTTATRSDRATRFALRVVDRVTGRLVAPMPASQHGRPGTYKEHGCRCEPCTHAATKERLQHKKRRRARVRAADSAW